MNMESVRALALLLVASSGAPKPPAAPIVADVAASSTPASVGAAFDALMRTAWCPNERDAVGAVTIRFSSKVHVRSLVLVVGDFRKKASQLGDQYKPSRVEITAGGPPITIDPTENGTNPLEIDVLKDREVESVVIRLPAGTGPQRCLADVDLSLAEGPWLFGAPANAATTLPAFVAEADAALRACDKKRIRALARWPLPRRELQVGFAGSELLMNARQPRPYASARAIDEKQCGWLVSDADEGVIPTVERSIGPGRVRIHAAGGGGVRYWDLAWRSNRWWLDAISFVEFGE